MSTEKTNLGNSKIISFEEIAKEKGIKEPIFSQGLYHWVMFVVSLYTRVRENLKIDFESFVILQVVVSHSLYEINKSGNKTFSELEDQITKITEKKSTKSKRMLIFYHASKIFQMLNTPLELTVYKETRTSLKKIEFHKGQQKNALQILPFHIPFQTNLQNGHSYRS